MMYRMQESNNYFVPLKCDFVTPYLIPKTQKNSTELTENLKTQQTLIHENCQFAPELFNSPSIA